MDIPKFPVSRIGQNQLVDVEHSGMEIHDDYFRTCTVLQSKACLVSGASIPISDIGDTSPLRMVKRFGETVDHWNKHFVVQVAGCPLRCWYCYVDNLEHDDYFTCQQLVDKFKEFREKVSNLNVFHLMGGCPARYSHMWPLLRNTLNRNGLDDVVLLTNVILVEHCLYDEHPWSNIPERTLVDVCIKGTNKNSFLLNTKQDLFEEAMAELRRYVCLDSVYYSMIEPDCTDVKAFQAFLGSENIDMLTVKMYEVVKRRQ